MSHTLVNGRHFLRCDDVGDVASGIDGLYADDTRRLSRWELAVDGHRPQPLAERATGHAELLLTQRVPHADGDVLVRRHLVLASDAFHERISFLHHGLDEIDLHVELRVASDGADLFTVKREEFTRVGGDAGTVGGIAARVGEGDGDGDGDASTRTTTVHLAPGVETHLDLHHGLGEAARDGGFDAALRATRDDLAAWRASMPQLSVDDPSIAATWQASLDDLAALRIPADPADGPGNLIAAGVPWFLTLFGRDAIITCLQTLVLGAHRARPTLRCLARLQATADEPDRDAEPGKILHELRSGAIAERGYDAYYGSIDSTPLFLMLLGEYHAWTADDELVRELWPSALAALTWLETRGDLDDDGFLEFARRSPHGLEVQSWKDSPDSQRHADGSIAQGPIAPIEAQAYAYAARVALARLARQVMGDDALAARLERDASRLRARFDAAFWSPTGYALALDGDKRPLAVPASNIGHLPWCGITGADRTAQIGRELAGPNLWSGWGVRTMGRSARGYDPLAYHCGSVWPHDTAIAAAGMARCGHPDVAALLARGLFDAAAANGGRLPELFAGLDRGGEGDVPVPYPTASSPQAWAAGAPVHLIGELLGLRPDTAARRLTSSEVDLPPWIEGLQLDGIEAFGQRWRANVRHGAVRVDLIP